MRKKSTTQQNQLAHDSPLAKKNRTRVFIENVHLENCHFRPFIRAYCNARLRWSSKKLKIEHKWTWLLKINEIFWWVLTSVFINFEFFSKTPYRRSLKKLSKTPESQPPARHYSLWSSICVNGHFWFFFLKSGNYPSTDRLRMECLCLIFFYFDSLSLKLVFWIGNFCTGKRAYFS